MKSITIFCIILIVKCFSSPMNLVLFDKNDYPEAQCLDGTQAGFYYQAGTGDGANKLLIYFEGGGACLGPTHATMMQMCYVYSLSELGSSAKWKQQIEGYGIMQDSQQVNPRFYNWNKVYIKYCGGTVHQGYLKDPLTWLGKKLYVKGLKGSQAAFDYAVKHYGLSSSSTTDVLLTGTSAGGLGTLYFADYVKDLVSSSTRYWAAPDSGFFINYYENGDNFMVDCINSLLNVADLDYVLPQRCPTINDPEQRYKCVLPQYFTQNIKSDLYIIMSEYDQFNLQVFLGVECYKHGSMADCSSDQKELTQDFRSKMIEQIEYVIDNKPNSNAWTVACIQHGFFTTKHVYNEGLFEVPEYSGNSPQEALYQWMYDSPSNRVNYIDKYQWPLNIPCNGLNSVDYI